MALDRQTIEKRDFPIGRRGYEPEAVDAHLAQIADEFEELRRAARGGSSGGAASMAQSASEQVRTIVEAAEASAAEIERAAREEADRIVDEAEAEARRTRDEAVAQSESHVGKVRQAATQMLQRVEAMESELGGLVETLRTSGNRMAADLSLLEGGMGELYDAAGKDQPPRAPRVVESVPMAVPADEPAERRSESEEPPEGAVAEAALAPDQGLEEPAPRAAAPAGGVAPEGGDVEGARLVALNMALNGSSREETAAYLDANFDLADRDGLLDEVFATVAS
ncbi:MAG TPA: DivIVA domain-containing protein [Baekduia sp.]|nr:DivIVA domain-containing protein [Baekduia sp.]